MGSAPARLARVGALRRLGAAPARRVDRARLDGARRARHAGLHRVVRPVRAGCAARRARPCFVSGAAGAVGSAAGQMARIAGCRVHRERRHGREGRVGYRELGFDGVFDYREQSARTALAELAPDGIDIYFDNVGGDHLEAAIGALAPARASGRLRLDLALQRRRADAGTAEHVHGRHEAAPPAGLHHHRPLRPVRRVRRAGSRVGARRAAAGTARPIVDGIENAPKAFLGLLRGENIGKMLVKVGPDE